MTVRIPALFFILLGLMVPLFLGCPAANSPSAPGAPAPTATPTITSTPCLVGGTPCTSTATSTPTNTGTSTFTPTSTDTPANTPTPCASNTPTSTNTPTGNFLFGSVNYTGAGTVNASHPTGFYMTDNLNGAGSYSAVQTSSVNGGAMTFTGIPFGPTITAYLVAFFDGAGVPLFNYYVGASNPGLIAHVGDSYGFYTASGVTFAPPNGGGSGNGNVTISNAGANTVGTVNLGSSYMINGVYGNVNYTGSLGTVNTCQPILVSSFTDSSYSSPNDYVLINQNNVRYDLCTFNQAPGTTLYLMAAYDAAGPCGPWWTGNYPNHVSVQYLGAYMVGTSTVINITIPDNPPGAISNGGC